MFLRNSHSNFRMKLFLNGVNLKRCEILMNQNFSNQSKMIESNYGWWHFRVNYVAVYNIFRVFIEDAWVKSEQWTDTELDSNLMFRFRHQRFGLFFIMALCIWSIVVFTCFASFFPMEKKKNHSFCSVFAILIFFLFFKSEKMLHLLLCSPSSLLFSSSSFLFFRLFRSLFFCFSIFFF